MYDMTLLEKIGSKAVLFLFFLSSVINCGKSNGNGDSNSFEKQRIQMVQEQIRARGIYDVKILEAMRKVPRHLFVPESYRNRAYGDSPLPIGEGQTISQPYIVAFMSEKLNPKKNEKVLEIGTGSGYQAAILAELCDSVFSIEIFESLGNKARGTLNELGCDNVLVKIGDGYKGWKEHAPFDAIIVTCSPSHIPEPLKEQLAEGGRMIIPVGETFTQKLVLLTKEDGKITKNSVLPVRFVPMIDDRGKKY